MKPRNTLILAALAALLVAGGWFFGVRANRFPAENEMVAGRQAFPGIAPRLQNAAKIEMDHEGDAVVLERHGDVWGVAQYAGYPTPAAKVHDLLAGLAELRLTERRTADPEHYARLGVEEPGTKADSTLVRVTDSAGKPLAALIVGHTRSSGQSSLPDQVFVRIPGEAQSWLAEGRLPLETSALMWLDRDIVNIDHTKIARVVSDPGGQHIELIRDGDKLVMKQPAEHPPLDPAKLGDVERALEFLTLLRVQPAANPGSAGLPGSPSGAGMPGKELGHGEFTTTDGLTLKVLVNQSGNETWARFGAAGNGAAKPEAERLEKKWVAWVYELGGWKEKVLVPSMDDLKAPAPAASATPPANASGIPIPAAASSPEGPPSGAPSASAAPAQAGSAANTEHLGQAAPSSKPEAVTPASAGSAPAATEPSASTPK